MLSGSKHLSTAHVHVEEQRVRLFSHPLVASLRISETGRGTIARGVDNKNAAILLPSPLGPLHGSDDPLVSGRDRRNAQVSQDLVFRSSSGASQPAVLDVLMPFTYRSTPGGALSYRTAVRIEICLASSKKFVSTLQRSCVLQPCQSLTSGCRRGSWSSKNREIAETTAPCLLRYQAWNSGVSEQEEARCCARAYRSG